MPNFEPPSVISLAELGLVLGAMRQDYGSSAQPFGGVVLGENRAWHVVALRTARNEFGWAAECDIRESHSCASVPWGHRSAAGAHAINV
jgi:hypothetical protein